MSLPKKTYLPSAYDATFLENLREVYVDNPQSLPPAWQRFFAENSDDKAFNVRPSWHHITPHAYKAPTSPNTLAFKGPQKKGNQDASPKPGLAPTWQTHGFELDQRHHLCPQEDAFFKEKRNHLPRLSASQKTTILHTLLKAHVFDRFLAQHFPGLKRFSLEGAEALLPGLNYLAEKAGNLGFSQILMAMAHRARLATRALFLEESLDLFFALLNKNNPLKPGTNPHQAFSGYSDVAYHLGGFGQKTFGKNPCALTLLPNPSHLESINPVLMGYARAMGAQQSALKSTALRSGNRTSLSPLSLLIHGEAAFSGQGVVAESLLLGTLQDYAIGGTLHILINNHVGFTASPLEAYGGNVTGPAHAIGAPVLHVDGLRPEALIHALDMALDWRQTFGRDIVINLLCFRKYGHNELDEPRFTNPHLYAVIDQMPPLYESYGEKLASEGLSDKALDSKKNAFKQECEQALAKASQHKNPQPLFPTITPKKAKDGNRAAMKDVKGLSRQALHDLGKALTHVPSAKLSPTFKLHPKIESFLKKRAKAIEEGDAIDWSTAEGLALGALIQQGVNLRLSGQDVVRGTFTQRHARFFSQDVASGAAPNKTCQPLPHASGITEEATTQRGRAWIFPSAETFSPFENLATSKSSVQLINSPLSEAGSLGFEIGYSWHTAQNTPLTLVVWEAQFGDFINGAQIHIDQYLSASWAKWRITSNLVLLLPHGYEGQGPEHSSGRIERFLQLAAENNLRIAMPGTPAAFFHLLREQALNPHLPPLVVFTPKSLLRNPLATSKLADLSESHSFQPLSINVKPSSDHHALQTPDLTHQPSAKTSEKTSSAPKGTQPKAKRLIFCSGKIYYDLLAAWKDAQKETTPQKSPRKGLLDEDGLHLVLLHQFYPFPAQQITHILKQHATPHTQLIWAQEEPKNMGAYTFVAPLFSEIFKGLSFGPLTYAGRPASASPATGFLACHQQETHTIMAQALWGEPD